MHMGSIQRTWRRLAARQPHANNFRMDRPTNGLIPENEVTRLTDLRICDLRASVCSRVLRRLDKESPTPLYPRAALAKPALHY